MDDNAVRVVGQRLAINCITKKNGGFARRGAHPYAHDFAPPPSFLFVWRGLEKKQNKTYIQTKKQTKRLYF